MRTPLPLPTDGLSPQQQRQAYRVVRINDALSLPEGYEQQLLASWGDPVDAAALASTTTSSPFAPSALMQPC